MGTINYLGMRRMYEKSGNKEALAQLITYYLHERVVNRPLEEDEVLHRVDLGESFNTTCLSYIEVISLILNDILQKNVLIERVLSSNDDRAAFFLYEKGQIGVDELQAKVLRTCFYKSVYELVANPQKYEGIDFIKLEKQFFEREMNRTLNESVVDIALAFLRVNPHSEIHNQMIEKIVVWGQSDDCYEIYARKQIIKFLTAVFRGRDSSYVLRLLEDKPDYYSLMMCPFTSPWLFFEDNDVYVEVKEEIFKNICAGKIERIARTLVSFRLNGRREEILNMWVENGRSLELDVYGIALLQGRLEDSLDDVYIQAKNKKDEVGPEQPMTMKPVIELKAQ